MVLSHGVWRRIFGGDPGVVGQQPHAEWLRRPALARPRISSRSLACSPADFLMNDEMMPTVASITQHGHFPSAAVWRGRRNRRGDENYNVLARLKPGVTMAQAEADVEA